MHQHHTISSYQLLELACPLVGLSVYLFVTRSPKRALLQLFIAKSSKKLLTGRDPGYMNSQEQKVAWNFQNDVSVHLYLGKLVKMINQFDVSLSPTQPNPPVVDKKIPPSSNSM